MSTPKLQPLALQEIASNAGFTHMAVITAEHLTETVANTTQAVSLFAGSIPKDAVVHKLELRVHKPFKDKSDKAFNSVTAAVGDSASATTFLAAKEVGGNNGRTYNDMVTNSTATVTSATAVFVAGDVGKRIVGSGIPADTFIGVRNSATSIGLSSSATANTPVAATATATGVTATIYGRTAPAVTTPNALMNTATGPYAAADTIKVLFTGLPTSKILNNLDEGELHLYVQLLDPKNLSTCHGTSSIAK